MTTAAEVDDWVRRYVDAWDTNQPSTILALFTADASYSHAPYDQAWVGRDRILREWLARKDAPGETSFGWTVVSAGEGAAVVTGTTTYPDTTYSNLWLVTLEADGACSAFAEWWMEHPQTS